MVQVVATQQGYFGGSVRYLGDTFDLPDALWSDEKQRPSWVVRVKGTPGRKPAPAQAAPAAPAAPVGNGLQQALGGTHPDWINPGAQAPPANE